MRYLILGGTGTLGTELTRQLLLRPHTEVTCLSRDELKQKQMASSFNSGALKFILGDIRDRDRMFQVMQGYNTVFHVAALKHVDILEEHPEESVKTNVLGTMNVADAAQANNIPYVVFSSTDKACDPINAYGMSKALSEKILLQRNRASKTKFSVFRWGNVIGSRGSLFHSLKHALERGNTYPLTDPEMTRFWIKIDEAVEFMLDNFRVAPIDRVLVPPIKASKVTDFADVVAELMGKPKPDPKIVGLRPGEKLHEVLSSVHTRLPVISSRSATMSREALKAMLAPLIEGDA